MGAPDVRALLATEKTQARRIIKVLLPGDKQYIHAADSQEFWSKRLHHCPYGKPGDQLWVRETWRPCRWMEGDPMRFEYSADGVKCEESGDIPSHYESWLENISMRLANECDAAVKAGTCQFDGENYSWPGNDSPIKWRSPIHMPRWASRIQRVITEIRAERLQDISEADAIAEGCIAEGCIADDEGFTAKFHFMRLWCSINGEDSWAENPLVWVVGLGVSGRSS